MLRKKLTLGKEERLKSRSAIAQLFSEGKNLSQAPYRLLYRFTGSAELRFGVGVSSKNFGKAVDRNRIKRLTREAYRLQKNDLQKALADRQTGLHLFFTFTGRTISEFKEVHEAIHQLLSKLLKSVNENPAPDT